MQLWLAPMEGLLDATLRDVLTRVGGVDQCVSEFIRVTDTLLPARVFRRIVPELDQGWRTPAGVLVRPQLLGSDPECLADNAAALAALGAPGVDLNFGCPTRVVNRHQGGAVLLKAPALMGRIVATVRAAVPAEVPVSAKMRLGYESDALSVVCAEAVAAAGANELTVHARTKVDGYRPPAYWERIAPIRAAVRIPVMANGEIWTVADALRCAEVSGCDRWMLGRGMVADPGLAVALRAHLTGSEFSLPWARMVTLLDSFWEMTAVLFEPRQRAGRLKQWLKLLARRYPQAQALYDVTRTLSQLEAVDMAWRQVERE